MDMEELSKSQIVLLTLFVSFVTSIATGIVTVALMQQAPPVVAETVNRVIERTIREVATSSQSALAATTIVETKPASASSIPQSIARASDSIVRLYSADGETFLAMGVVISSDGRILTDISVLGDNGAVTIKSARGLAMGEIVTRDKANGIAYIAATSSNATSSPKISAWVPASIAPVSELGSYVISIAGKSTNRIGSGIITSLPAPKSAVIETNVPEDGILPGSPLINSNGEIIGIRTGDSSVMQSGFTPLPALIQGSLKETDVISP